MTAQTLLVPAMAALHNFIRTYDPDDDVEPWDEAEHYPEATTKGEIGTGTLRAEVTRANRRRDEIAWAMWKSYERITKRT